MVELPTSIKIRGQSQPLTRLIHPQHPLQWLRARQAFSDLQMMVYVRIPLEPGLESYIQVVPEQTILHHVSDDVNPAPNLKQITEQLAGAPQPAQSIGVNPLCP